MKRIQRRRHLALWLLIVPIVGFVVWQAITERSAAPELDTLPAALLEGSQ